MTRRLRVLFEVDELDGIRTAARRQRMTVSAWVRSALREAVLRERVAAKLAAIDQAGRHAFPTGDVEEMVADIHATGVEPSRC